MSISEPTLSLADHKPQEYGSSIRKMHNNLNALMPFFKAGHLLKSALKKGIKAFKLLCIFLMKEYIA